VTNDNIDVSSGKTPTSCVKTNYDTPTLIEAATFVASLVFAFVSEHSCQEATQ